MKDKKVPVWMSIVLLIIVFVSMLLYVRSATATPSTDRIIACVLYCVTMVFAYFYCFMGYQKDSAKYFKWFCVLYAVYQLGVIVRLTGVADIGPVVCHAAPIWFMGAFYIAENLGRKKSFLLAGINFLVAVIALVFGILSGHMTYAICNLTLALVFIMMVYAKYIDKANRGTI